MNAKEFSFLKSERLKSSKEISRMLTNGIFLFSEHLKFCFIEGLDSGFNKLAVTVPKKHFKSAVKRNKIKRRIHEVYRLNKDILYRFSEKTSKHYNLMFIYKSNEQIAYQLLRDEIIYLLNKMVNKSER